MRTHTEAGRALQQARENTDALFRLVKPGSLYDRPIAERHRMIFYLGHLEAFDWNLIARYALNERSFEPEFDQLFAFGIDPPPGELPSDQPADWPSLDEVHRYVRRTREKLDGLIGEVPEQLRHVAIEHRLMHAETYAYILHQLPYENKVAPDNKVARGNKVAQHIGAPGDLARQRDQHLPEPRNLIEFSKGMVHVGQDPSQGFGWDNEFQAHCVEVPAFAVAPYKVTNGEYLEFVRQGAEAPFFWGGTPGRRTFRGMFEEYALPLDTPVYVTHDQASAYAAWRGMRLPTEAEYHRAASGAAASSNANFRYWDPIPVTADDPDEDKIHSRARPMQMAGNGWEWTSTVFAPFPGFQPFPFYANYSEPFFDGSHYVLKGASPRTAACFLRPSFRNWFRPSYPYVYGTFRLVAS